LKASLYGMPRLGCVVSLGGFTGGYELGTWAWNFWGVAIFQGLSFFGLLFLYHPPKHGPDDPH
jgi:hypothetical protein